MVSQARWPIDKFGVDLTRAIPAASVGIGGVWTKTPSLVRLPDELSVVPFVPDGTSVSSQINALIAATAAAGKLLWIFPGTYTLDAQINLVSGARVWCDDGVIFERGMVTTGVFGMLSQASFASKIIDARWRGGFFKNTADLAGSVIGFYGDQVQITDLLCTNVEVGLVAGFSGDDNLLFNIYARTAQPAAPPNPGGIRNWGGNRNRVLCCDVISSDDCYQFAPSGSAFVLDQSIADSLYANCVGGSTKGHLINSILQNAPVVTASIKRVSFIGMKASIGGRLSSIQNTTSAGIIEGVNLIDCSIDCSADTTGGAVASVQGATGKLVKGVYHENCRIIAPLSLPYNITGDVGSVEDVHWIGGKIDGSRVGGQHTAKIDTCIGGSIKGARIIASGAEGIKLGTAAATDVVGFVIEGNRIDEVDDGDDGVLVFGASYAKIGKNKIKRKSTATTSIGILINAAAANCVVSPDNDLSEVDTTIVVNSSARNSGNLIQRPEFDETIATDVDITLDVLSNKRNIQHTGTLTANRAVTLSLTNAVNGDWFLITRTGPGAFNLNVGTGPLKALAVNTWGMFKFNGTAWYLASYGAL